KCLRDERLSSRAGMATPQGRSVSGLAVPTEGVAPATGGSEVPYRRGAECRPGSAAAVPLCAGSTTSRQAKRAAEADLAGILGRQVGANREVAAVGNAGGGIGNRGNEGACRGHEMSPCCAFVGQGRRGHAAWTIRARIGGANQVRRANSRNE